MSGTGLREARNLAPADPRKTATRPDGDREQPIKTRLNILRSAFSQLLQSRAHPAQEMNQVMDQIYTRQESIADRTFTVRFFAALLAESARASGYEDGFVVSATFAWKDAEGKSGKLVLAGE